MSELTSPDISMYETHPHFREYGECEPEQLELTTDLADDLLLSAERSGSDIPGVISFGTGQSIVKRSFNYLESDRSSGWTWPLTETSVTIAYLKDRHPTKETYHVEISRQVHQKNLTPAPLVTIYTIEYFGKDRDGVKASVDAPNFDITSEPYNAWEDRAMTGYDADALFTELDRVHNLLKSQARENLLLDELA